ncbi:hypothetical protein Hamer_G011459 [Homarus americanus]|uniref:Uncharacterized protein n=1 Tax=Homarus americanus TaxID=6706 RepID=A0A8J5MP91_HOMAM|nr:hypothetical protein Hamer_G011459 [Homarus americanus]
MYKEPPLPHTGHGDHGGYGSHSNVQPVTTVAKAGPASGFVPMYVPASSSKSPTLFSPSLSLVPPPRPPTPTLVAAPSYTPSSTSSSQPLGLLVAGGTPKGTHTFESFGDFAKFI